MVIEYFSNPVQIWIGERDYNSPSGDRYHENIVEILNNHNINPKIIEHFKILLDIQREEIAKNE